MGDALGSVRQLTDSAGAVTLTQSYAPYGETISSVGSGVSTYQFTGEARDASGLTYLRARYYNSGDGRFLSRDTWNGDYNRPLSLNRWGYVEGNPVNLTDPSGFNAICTHPWCVYQRVDEILEQNRGNGVKALASLFSDTQLQTIGGDFVGRTSEARLEWLMSTTLGSNKSIPLDFLSRFSCALPGELLAFHFQFRIPFPSGEFSGLPDELEDSQFYNSITWIKQESNQIAHFLSAVAEYYYKGRDLQLIIAHEKYTDPCEGMSLGCVNEMRINLTNEVTPGDRSHFYKAWHYDTNGMYAKRDQELWAILDFDTDIVKNLGDVDPARQGNSLQDLRLSLRGVRFAAWVMSNRSSPPSEAGQWLTTNLSLP